MIFSYCLMLLWFSTLVNTQSLSDEINSLPSCSDSCLDIATGSLGCGVGDFSCFCADESGSPTQGSTVSSATSCIKNSCSLLDASTTLKVVGQICVLINDPTSSISISSSTTSRASSSSTTSLKSIKTSSSSTLSSSMASKSVTATSTPTSLTSAPSITSTSSQSSSGKGLSNVVIGMIVLAVVATLLILAFIARLLRKRRANRKNSTGGRFQNLDEEDGTAKKPMELQGNDTQILKWGGIGVRKSVRVHTQRITSYISPISPKHRSRNESWGDARDHLATIDENLRGVGQSSEPVGRIDTSPVRWPSTSTANSPTTPEMTEPMGALFPPHHYRINLSRESLPPSLPALDLPSITLSSTSRPNTPHQPLPKSPPPQEVSVKTIARLDRPFSDFPHQMPPSPQTAGIPYGTLARSLSVSDNYSYPRAFPTPSRHSIASIPNTPHTPTTTNFISPISPPLPSPSAQSFHTFGARSSTYSQASISTFQTFPTSPEDTTDIPPLPTIPTIYPMSTYTLTSHGSRRRASASASEIPRSQTKRYHHSKQTSLSKIKPKMIYISTTPGISIMPSDFIFMGTPEPDLRETTSNNPFLTNTNTNVNTDTNTNTNPSPPDPPTSKNPTKPTVSITIKPLIDRFDTISSNSNSNASLNSTSRSHNSQRSSEKLKLQARTEEIFLEEGEKECFREGKQEKSSRRMERLLRGSGKESGRESVDLGVRDRSWFDASG